MNPSGKPSEGVCRKNEFLCANSVMLCDSAVKLPGKTFTTEARSLHREPRRTFSDRLLKRGVNERRRVRRVPARRQRNFGTLRSFHCSLRTLSLGDVSC